MDLKKLHEPFPAEDIEWRVARSGKKGEKVWALCLAYVTQRAIQERLDDVVGPENWKNDFKEGPNGGLLAGISIYLSDRNEWVTKWDGADNTQVEAIKGGLSGAMKRAGVQWGIGRYLYNLTEAFCIISDNGKNRGKTKEGAVFNWDPPALPDWALPRKPIGRKDLEFLKKQISETAEVVGCDESDMNTAVYNWIIERDGIEADSMQSLTAKELGMVINQITVWQNNHKKEEA